MIKLRKVCVKSSETNWQKQLMNLLLMENIFLNREKKARNEKRVENQMYL